MKFDDDCEILCLCGDLGYPEHDNYTKLLTYVSSIFKYVFVITGNHEYYDLKRSNKTIESTNLMITEICKNFSNVYFLNNNMIYLEEYNLVVLGTTLWSYFDIDKINEKMFKFIYKTNDFNKILYEDYKSNNQGIFKLDINKRNDMFINSCNFITESLEFINNTNDYPKVLIMSHHLPSYQLMDEQYRFLKNSFIYATNLEHFFKNYKIDAWLCGHAHTHNEIYINNSYLGINAYGYPEKNIKPIFNKFIYI
jgi:hypothetical protein